MISRRYDDRLFNSESAKGIICFNEDSSSSIKHIQAGSVSISSLSPIRLSKKIPRSSPLLSYTSSSNGTSARIEQSVPAVHTDSESFDVDSDLGSPVSLDYYDRAPFKFNGKIEKIHISYIDTDEIYQRTDITAATLCESAPTFASDSIPT